jgi:predicted SAM-dependent methyltransferase
MKYNLACGPLPLHKQHLDYMGDLTNWTLIDLYYKDPSVKNWDATKLDEIEDNSAEEIYSSHFLEHVSLKEVRNVLALWYRKLKAGGKIYINVPDLTYSLRLINKYENGQPLDGYYNRIDGEHGLLNIIYGNQAHEGEYHKSGYTSAYFEQLLIETGLKNVEVHTIFEAHDMNCLIGEGFK